MQAIKHALRESYVLRETEKIESTLLAFLSDLLSFPTSATYNTNIKDILHAFYRLEGMFRGGNGVAGVGGRGSWGWGGFHPRLSGGHGSWLSGCCRDLVFKLHYFGTRLHGET